MAKKKLMIHDFYRMKRENQKISWLTSYPKFMVLKIFICEVK